MNTNTIENAYYKMAHTLNAESTYEEVVKSINNALEALLQSINTDIPTNNFMVYNILLIANLFIRTNEEKYCGLDSFKDIKILLNLLNFKQNKPKGTPKR